MLRKDRRRKQRQKELCEAAKGSGSLTSWIKKRVQSEINTALPSSIISSSKRSNPATATLYPIIRQSRGCPPFVRWQQVMKGLRLTERPHAERTLKHQQNLPLEPQQHAYLNMAVRTAAILKRVTNIRDAEDFCLKEEAPVTSKPVIESALVTLNKEDNIHP
uniref:Uncharacterized protein n=1 Tax=Nothobranchius furzeri TaxID=105023 RepID=A0A1A8AND3_NOTFU